MDFTSDNDQSQPNSVLPPALQTNQSADYQLSDTESQASGHGTHRSQHGSPYSTTNIQYSPGGMADVAYMPAGVIPLGGSGRSSDRGLECSIQSDITTVDITDLDGEESINLTTTTLKRCKEEVLRPYWRLLMFIAWREFGRESINPSRLHWRILNILYTLLLVALLIYSYVYEVLACEWKLNVHYDTGMITHSPPRTTTAMTPIPSNVTRHWIPWANISEASIITTTVPVAGQNASHVTPAMSSACDHIITTYVIPNVLHFIAYIIGFFYFRIMENEHLYALMEKVFLQASPLQGRLVSQSNMIKKLRLFLGLGALWVILTIVLQVLYVLAFGIQDLGTHGTCSSKPCHNVGEYWTLLGIQVVGILVTSSVSLAVVINYASQCEILIFFIHGIQMRIQEKTGDLKSVMKDILAVRQSLGQLNGAMSRMTSLMVITFAEMVVIGVTILIINQYPLTMIWIYRACFPAVWSVMFFFPLIQAARTNSACAKFKRIALETRVFGYQNSSLLELDSFLLFVSNTRLRAKLFHIPIQPSYLAGILVLASFFLLVMLQSGYLGHKEIPYWL